MDTGLVVGLAGIVLGIMGVAYGVWWTKHQAKRSSRSTLRVSLSSNFELRPSAYQPDLSKVLKISWNGTPLGNIVCLGLQVRLEGYQDLDDPTARTPPAPGAPSRPRIDFANFKVLSVGTVANDPNIFEIPLAKANNDTALYLNVVRLRANADAHFTVVGTKREELLPISATLAEGYIKQVDLEPSGLLTRR